VWENGRPQWSGMVGLGWVRIFVAATFTHTRLYDNVMRC
jgi:hypothetical protein